MFDKNSNVPYDLKKYSDHLTFQIEQKFNTTIYDYGVTSKGSKDFIFMTPFGITPPNEAYYIFYFLIPVDKNDYIISNDYYDKIPKSKGYIPIHGFRNVTFYQSLIDSDELVNFIQSKVHSIVYDFGSYTDIDLNNKNALVPNASKIKSIQYKFYRFFGQAIFN